MGLIITKTAIKSIDITNMAFDLARTRLSNSEYSTKCDY